MERQWQLSGTSAGVMVWFTDGTAASVNDQDGYPNSADGLTQVWHYRRFDLSAYAGKTLNYVELDTSGNVTSGNWACWYEDISLVWADGTILPLFNGQSSITLYAGDVGGGTESYQVDNENNAGMVGSYDETTEYYHGDHLGSARLMTNNSGYPVWSATFLPFGQEWNPQITVNHYKFTGKERDSESGLDNFGARYNSSQYGRFMTPDPAGKQSAVITNPQTWNKYSYVLNNPLRLVDPSGKFPTDAHIYWGEIALAHIGFTGDASRLSRGVNGILDQGYFFSDRLHALSGDAAFQAARSQLFSMALDSNRSNGERGVALMMGMHLVEDYQAHKGLVGVWAHAKKYDKYPFDANPNSKEGRQALADALRFANGVQTALDNSLGDEAGQAKLNEILNAATDLMNTDLFDYAVHDISRDVNQNGQDHSMSGTQSFSNEFNEEQNRQCGFGNRAACH